MSGSSDAPGGLHASASPARDDGAVSVLTGSRRRTATGRAAATPPTGVPGAGPRRGGRGRTSPFFVSALDGSPAWVTGALAALQGALLSLLVVVLPSVAAYVATSADPANEGVEWFRSVVVGTSLWAAGHGVPPVVAGSAVTLVPLGVTLLALFTAWASARRSGVPERAALVAGTATYAAVTAVLSACVGGPVAGVRGLLGGAAVAGAGLGLGLLARPDAPTWRELTRRARDRVPVVVGAGLEAATVAAATTVLAASVVTLGWVLAGRTTIVAIADGLGVDLLGGAVLALAELAFAPVLVVWAVAWLAGPGFVVGEGTHFAPDAMTGGTLPAVPLLGALPGADLTGGPALLAPVLVVAAGAVAGWSVHRSLRARTGLRAWSSSLACVVTAAGAGLVVACLVLAASGAVGPGRMATVGASAPAVAGAVAGWVLLGALVVAVPADPRVRAAVRAGVAALVGRVVPRRRAPRASTRPTAGSAPGSP